MSDASDLPPPTDPWTPGVRAFDIPVVEGGDPSPFADLDDAPPEDETYSNSDIDTRKLDGHTYQGRDRSGDAPRRHDAAAARRAHQVSDRRQQDGSCRGSSWRSSETSEATRTRLRTNENVLQISGIEVEHDAGEIAFGTALATILKAEDPLHHLHVASPTFPASRSAGAFWCRCRRTASRRCERSSSRASTACSAASSRRKASCCRRRICTAASRIIPTTASR